MRLIDCYTHSCRLILNHLPSPCFRWSSAKQRLCSPFIRMRTLCVLLETLQMQSCIDVQTWRPPTWLLWYVAVHCSSSTQNDAMAYFSRYM
jgi:hypothetical protein